MEVHNNVKTFYATNRREWRKWLAKNYNSEKSLWLIIYHKSSSTKSIYYEEAVEEAICFGWIDSIANKRNDESKYQFFSVRKPKSNWSRANRERAKRMIKEKKMKPAGLATIRLAKKMGTWTALVDVQNAVIPPDLKKAFDKNKVAFKNFVAFPPSSKRIVLEWILNAKKSETRKNRIDQTIDLAVKNLKANHYRQKIGR